MASLMPNGKQQFFKQSGAPLAGGKIYTYLAGTSTPKATFSDAAGTVQNANPITLDARGEALVYWSGSYKIALQDSASGAIYTVDNYVTIDTPIAAASAALAASTGAALMGFLQAGTGASARTAQAKMRESVSVRDFGALGDWDGAAGTDDAVAFQAAIDFMFSIGGGDVRIPPVAKAYRLGAKLTLRSGVRLIGTSSRQAISWYQSTLAGYYGGACLAITWGAGTTASMAIEMLANTTVSGLTFIYPGQVSSLLAAAPIDFPPTIAGNDGTSPGGAVENCNFVNSRKAIYFPFGHGELMLRHIWGTVLGDFITLNGTYNADQLHDINVSGIHYLRSSADANFTNNTGLWAWIQTNGRAFVIGYADAIRFSDCFVGNCGTGISFGYAPASGSMVGVNQFAYGSWTGGGMEGVTFPIYVQGSTTSGINSNGFRFSDAGIAPVALFNAARAVAVVMQQPNTTFDDATEARGKLQFSNCAFWGIGNWQTNTGPLEGVVDATGGDIEFYGCTFRVWQSYIARAYSGKVSVKMAGCDFLDNRTLSGNLYHFTATATAGTLIRLFLGGGNDFKGYFGSNFPLGTSEVYETPQPYSFAIPSVASADPLPIAAIGRSFTVTGATGFSYVTNPYRDRVVTLRFAGTATANNAGNLKLASAFVAAAGTTLTLIGDGSTWYEQSRKST